MATVTVVNTRTTPYIVDDEGHLLPGGARGEVDDTNSRVRWALDAGVLVETETSPSRPASETGGAPSGTATSTPVTSGSEDKEP